MLFLHLPAIENIYLLREESHIRTTKKKIYMTFVEDVAQDLLFVSIKGLKESYNKEIKRLLQKCNLSEENLENDDRDYSIDLIFVCFC